MIDRYIEVGWDLKLIPAGEKGPRVKGWPDLQLPILSVISPRPAISGCG